MNGINAITEFRGGLLNPYKIRIPLYQGMQIRVIANNSGPDVFDVYTSVRGWQFTPRVYAEERSEDTAIP